MAASIGTPARQSKQSRRAIVPPNRLLNIQERLRQGRRRIAPLLDLWTKINNDWIFNWAAALAYALLTSILPIFLAILAVGGFILGTLSLSSLVQLESVLTNELPGGASGAGGEIVNAALVQLHRNAGVLLLIGIVGSIIAGSGLFLSLESVLNIVFRLKGRDPIPQRMMAIGMVLLYVVLVPIMVIASLLPSAVLGALHLDRQNPGGAFLLQLLGLLVGFATAFVFFGSIYFVVPNRRMRFGEVWPGALAAALLLVLYVLAFPIYENLFLRGNYGSIIGFIVVILIFFYYLAFILLLGAEINSMVLGLRPTTKSLSALLQALEEQDLMIEPLNSDTTTSQPFPEVETHAYPTDTYPADAYHSLVAPPPDGIGRPSMSTSERATLTAILVAGGVAVIGAVRLGRHLLHGER
ncbi:MAG: YihY/virulence factor BrkB family protein [Ktedonobacterales bacterium]